MPVFQNLSNESRETYTDRVRQPAKRIQDVLVEKAGGTLLWASLVLKEREDANGSY
jgi:hypothetical protein